MISLAVVTFCLFALLSILSVGAMANRDSSDYVQTATTASLLISDRRSAPTNSLGSTFPIFPLTNSMTQSGIFVSSDGTLASGAQGYLPVYRMSYTVTTNANNTASLYCCLSWPAAVNPTTQPLEVKGRYELYTCIPLPPIP